MENKKPFQVNGEQAKKLFDKGYISEEMYNSIAKKYASGGVVTPQSTPSTDTSNPIAQILSAAASNPTQSVSPEIAQKVEAAKENTAVQQGRYMGPRADINIPSNGFLGSALADEARQRMNFKNSQTPAPLAMASDQHGQDLIQLQQGSQVNAQPDQQKELPGAEQAGLIKNTGTQGSGEYDPMQAIMRARKEQAGTYDQAFKQMAGGISAEAAAGAKAAAAESAAYTTAANELQDWQKKQDVINQKHREAIEKQNEILNQKIEDYQKSATIDPNRFWANKSTGDKIMAGIGIFLGGLGRNGGNDALQIVQNAINRDIDAQKTQLQSKSTAISMQNNIYSNMLNQFQDERAAEQATRLSMLNIAEMKLKQVAAANQGPMVQAKAQQAIGQLQMQKAQIQGSLMQSLQASIPMLAANEQMQKINFMVKPEHQSEAIKELGELQKHEKGVNVINESLDTMFANRARLTPEQAQKYDAARAIMLSNTTELFGGKSEQEFERMVEGFASGRLGTKDAFEQNRKLLLDKYESQKSYPLLDSYNIRHKPLNLTRN